MKRLLLLLPLLAAAQTIDAQKHGRPQLDESYTFNEVTWAPRPTHYRPCGEGVQTVDGKARYNRALYGAHTGFRVECSDRPEFGIYLPGMGGHLRIELPAGSCTARYTAGRMDYAQGGVELEVQVLRSSDAAFWRLSNTTDRPQRIGIRFGGVSGRKFYRNGDLGVDPPDSFDLKTYDCETNRYRIDGSLVRVAYEAKVKGEVTLVIPLSEHRISILPHLEGVIELPPHGERTIVYFPRPAEPLAPNETAALLRQAERERRQLAASLRIETPDAWINPIAGALGIAADGIWSGRTWLHGAVGWRTEHLGWRGAYVGDALGWHERARTHFTTYASNQVTDVEPDCTHPQLDSALCLARAEKRWGTPMYSNGYICRRPGRREMSHYDMNLVYVDALLRHLRATGDTLLMRQLFPVIDRHLQWEKRNFDPDGDHLYDAYCCIWASDALFYGGGPVTHSSAYNYFAFRETARIAERLGIDPTPYRTEAEAIRRALYEQLWDPEELHWGEYRDATGHRRLHSAAGLWTVYHAIDSEIGDPFEAAATAVYALEALPKAPVARAEEKTEAKYPSLATYRLPATTSWQPYQWSIHNVAVAEVMHTALACWQAGLNEQAFRLMKGLALDNMYLGTSPLNFGQLSYLDAARGECYRDFADAIGIWARALVEGLFGIRPDLIGDEGRVELHPGFPAAWEHAAIELPDIAYRMERDSCSIRYAIDNRYPVGTRCELFVPLADREPVRVTVDGRETAWEAVEPSFEEPRIRIPLGAARHCDVRIETRPRTTVKYVRRWGSDGRWNERRQITEIGFAEHETPSGLHFWRRYQIEEFIEFPLPDTTRIRSYRPVDLSACYNARLTELYRNTYRSNRSGTTTLQIPLHGFGEWCHPTDTVALDDSGLRRLLREAAVDDRTGVLTAACEPLCQEDWQWAGDKMFPPDTLAIPFRMAHTGPNICYTSLWEQYPDRLTVPLSGHGRRLVLVLAGSTNPMQSRIENGIVRVRYADGSSAEPLALVNPDNWAPVEQILYHDYYTFQAPFDRLLADRLPLERLHLATGTMSRFLDRRCGIEGVGARYIEGGAAVVLRMPVDPAKELAELEIETLSNDVVIGLMAVTVGE